MSFPFPDPPTEQTLADARRALDTTLSAVSNITSEIDAAEAALAQIVKESRYVINEMLNERTRLEEEVLQTRAYLSPIRRLPTELLRDIFMWSFEEYPCCAWVLAGVCTPWRRLALKMPKIWSKIRLLTTQHSSADTIRLWLERSGDSVPLDIEIFLRVTGSESSSRRRRHSLSLSPPPSPPSWPVSFSHQQGTGSHYVIPHPPITPSAITVLPPPHTAIVLPPSPGVHDTWLVSPHSANERTVSSSSRSSLHWGHIATYYLVEQMHRWERFIFRFDKHFTSMSALKSINGDAPLLREFEISSAEAAFYPEWQWLPNAPPTATLVLPKLKTLTLQHTPFKWSSPMLRTNLHTLNLRALPTSHLALDRILYIIANNPALESLTLHFQGVSPAILPLSPTTLHSVKTFNIGGHYVLSQLVDSLILPALDDLTLDIEARDPIEETISNLLTRSNSPQLVHLSVAYGSSSNSSTFYYGPSGIVISWTTLLTELVHLKSLHIGGTPFEPLLSALGPPDDDTNQMTNWACPKLEVLGMRNCHSHSEGIGKLVQMVEGRNPDSPAGGGGGGPVKLKVLELHDCASLGGDVVQWLKGRIDEVVCTEPAYERSLNPYI